MRLVPRAVAALILASTCALGAPTDQREKLYTEGLGCLEKRSFACAATKFRDALAIKSTAAVVHALGLAERGSGHPLRARELFRQAVKDAEKEKDTDTLRGARAALDAIDQEIPRLVLRLPGDVTPTRALVDGREVDVEEGGIAIEPGQHTLVVEAAGRSPFRSSFVAKAGTIGKSAGDRVEVSVTFAAIAPQDPSGGAVAAPPRREPATNGPPTGAIVLGGAGVALGIGALVWWQKGSSESDGANLDAEACTAPCPADRQAEILAKHDQGSSRVRTAQYLGAASVGLVIGSAVWWALTPSASPASARVTAAPASGGGFVSLTTSFLGYALPGDMRAHHEPGAREARIRAGWRLAVRAPGLRSLPTVPLLLALSFGLHASCTSDAPTFPSDTGGGAGASGAAGTGGSSGAGDAGAAGTSAQGGGGASGAGAAGSAGGGGKSGGAGAGAAGGSAGASGAAGAPSCGPPQFASKADARVIPQQSNCDLNAPLKLPGKFGEGQVSQWFRAEIIADTKVGIGCQTDAFVSAVVVSENVQVCASAKCGQGTEKQCPAQGCCGSNGIKATFNCVDATVDGGGASQAAEVFIEVRRMGTPTGCLDYILQVDTF